jgi:AAA15 family ATPase/GTPase
MIKKVCLHPNKINLYLGDWLVFEDKQGASFIFEGNAKRKETILVKDNFPSDPNGNPQDGEKLLYFPAGLASLAFNQKADENENTIIERTTLKKINSPLYFYAEKRNLEELWQKYYNKIKDYRAKEANFRINLTRQIEDGKNGIDLKFEIESWKNVNPNPTEIVAKECLDILLNKFFLSVKTQIDDVRETDILPIRSLNNNKTISYETLSTGTKQVIYTAFPIYQLLQDDSIVLMDEPETSLYPDIQREIIPYYTSFDKNKTSQFFFATHSPIIASSFEPWEIVELKFDEKGKVYRDKYYEGENHVDNYRLDPQILRYDQILTRIFDLSGDSDAKRAEKLQELAILKKKVEQLKKEEMEKPTPETQKIINKYLQLSDDISGTWALSRHEKN